MRAFRVIAETSFIYMKYKFKIFQWEEWIALYFCLFEKQTEAQALKYLKMLLRKYHKGNPIALQYTYHLLSNANTELHIIQLVSKLANLYKTRTKHSIQQILSPYLLDCSFICQVRHALVHKQTPSKYIINKAKQSLIDSLKKEYWENTFQDVVQKEYIDINKVEMYINRVANKQIAQYFMVRQKIPKKTKKIRIQDLLTRLIKHPSKASLQSILQFMNQNQIEFKPGIVFKLKRLYFSKYIFQHQQFLKKLLEQYPWASVHFDDIE